MKPLILIIEGNDDNNGSTMLKQAVDKMTHRCDTRKVNLIPPHRQNEWFDAAHIVVVTATEPEQTIGQPLIALAHAMSCGTPAVNFTIPGSEINELNLNGVTGIEVHNGNIDQLAAAIDHLLSHDEMRREYGRAAKQRAQWSSSKRTSLFEMA